MIERLLMPDSIEVPPCRCGVDMAFKSLTARSADVGLKVFECPSCLSEMQLMIWLPQQSESGTSVKRVERLGPAAGDALEKNLGATLPSLPQDDSVLTGSRRKLAE